MAQIDDTIPQDYVQAVKSAFRANWRAIRGRVADLPDALDPNGNQATAHAGKACVIGSNGARVVQSSDTVTFALARLSQYRLPYTQVTANVALTDQHCGQVVCVDSSSNVVVTLSGNSISDGFVCLVRRLGAGEVTFAATDGIAIQHPDGHSKVDKRYDAVLVTRIGSAVFLDGPTRA